jgi:hypothetical protein
MHEHEHEHELVLGVGRCVPAEHRLHAGASSTPYANIHRLKLSMDGSIGEPYQLQ